MTEHHTRQGIRAWALGVLAAGVLVGGAGVACAAEPPPVTAEERTAAFPQLDTTHMHDEPLRGMFKAEELEWQDRDGAGAMHWDVTAWLGYEANRLWLRSEGRHEPGEQADNRLELLWTRPVSAWWDVQAGARLDTGPGPSRTYAALGVQGLAPQWLHVEATAYVGDGGQIGARLQTDYEWLLTNRVMLAARLEADAWSQDDAPVGIGSGLSDITAGLRLRYEIRRELAPYIGVEWTRLVGDTADLARESGMDRHDTRLVAGLRFWF